MGTFSLTDVAEKGDEGSGSLCPRGSSALDKQTQGPFLQGQGTRGTVTTPCSRRPVSTRPAPARWRLQLGATSRAGGRATGARDRRSGQPWPRPRGEGAPFTLLRESSTPGWSASPKAGTARKGDWGQTVEGTGVG